VLDHKKAIQQLKRQRWNGEEIEGNDHLPVILEKRQPTFARVATASNST
jgi:hypothetical protein